MLLHSFKMIWAERKSNAWILTELIIVFTILWFCSSFIYEKGKKYFEPKGFDIEHTYLLQFNQKRNASEEELKDENQIQAGITIFDRIKKYSGIESVGYARGNAYPYSTSYSQNSFTKDSVQYSASLRDVSADFFDVFKIKFQKGRAFDVNETSEKKRIIISPDQQNKFFNESILSTTEIVEKELDRTQPPPTNKEEWRNAKTIDVHYSVIGVLNKMKRGDYENYERIVFYPLSPKALGDRSWTFIVIRVKANVDKNFSDKFMKEMKSQLNVGSFELADVKPFSEIRDEYMKMTGDEEKVQTVFVVISFLLVNVFLGIIGTFRFRTNARRGEIGLRCALGSSRSKVRQLLLGETFFILLVASIPGTLIALNLQLTGLLSKIGVSMQLAEKSGLLTRAVGSDESFLQISAITYLITFVMMLIIIWLGTWYPAKKASQIQPAEALHYE